ncbi:tetratricopeptide repeat protein [Nitrosopumilus sp.]|uniref:tetratricopeptide repeat protein n=1 Tax=Nitrosopumilus sp. TaxID=2024843 RepID=UPI00293179C2|nr:tetratricopeptide repeat protein [Nitrosopumilus sp.]
MSYDYAYSDSLSVDGDLINLLINEGKHDQALSHLESALTTNPKDRDALFYKGFVLDKQGKYELALMYYNKALLANSDNPHALFGKAVTLENLKNYEKAIEYYDKVLAADPQNEDAISHKQNLMNNKNIDVLDSSEFEFEATYFDYRPLSMNIFVPDATSSDLYVSEDHGLALRFPDSLEKWTIKEDPGNSKTDFKKNHSNTSIQLSYFEEETALTLAENVSQLNKTQKVKLFQDFITGIFSLSQIDINITAITFEEFFDGSRINVVYVTTDKKNNSAVVMSTFLLYNEGKIILLDFHGDFFNQIDKENFLKMFTFAYLGDVANIDTSKSLTSSSNANNDNIYVDPKFSFSISPPAGWDVAKTRDNYTVTGWSFPITFVGYNEDYKRNAPPTIGVAFTPTNSETRFDKFSDQELIDIEHEDTVRNAEQSLQSEIYVQSEKLERFDKFVKITVRETLDYGNNNKIESESILWKFKDGRQYSLDFIADPADFDVFYEKFLETSQTFDLVDNSIQNAKKVSLSETNNNNDDEYISKNDVSTDSNDIIILGWIKTNAGWWANDEIDDETFVSGIQYLIKEEIISVSSTNSSDFGNNLTEKIPQWIKNNADWWAQEMITDEGFLKGIKFLVENGIIDVVD